MRRIAIIIGLACIASEAISQTQSKEAILIKPEPVEFPIEQVIMEKPVIDTVRRVLIVYTKIPGYVWTKVGFCIRRNRICIRNHLSDEKKRFKNLHVLMCTNEEGE